MFLSSVADYESMNDQFPLPESMNIGGDNHDPHRYWTHVLHASLLRKFYFGHDELSLGKIYDAIDMCIVDLRPGMRDTLDELRVACVNHRRSTTVGHVIGNRALSGEGALTIDDLYGRHLHGDYGRWERVRANPGVFKESVLLTWNVRARQLLRWTRQVLDMGVREGSISIERA